jgi:predicted nucleic acid-binding protein
LIYVDTSVLLAQILAEDRRPPPGIWTETLTSSRLTEYEVWTRVHGRGLGGSHGDAVRELLGRLSFIELSPIVLARSVEPFPLQVRTLDALHLASIEYLRGRRVDVRLAAYDRRMREAARALGIPLVRL